jgi:hypothetical protein
MSYASTVVCVGLTLAFTLGLARGADPIARRPTNDSDLRFWLENMLVHHQFTREEAAAVTGLSITHWLSRRRRRSAA